MTSHGNQEDRIEGLLSCFGARAADPLLSFLDAEGEPFGLRCAARWTGESFLITIVLPEPGSTSGAVLASLLWHHHDERLEDQRSMMLRGVLEESGSAHDAAWVFRLTAPPALMGLEPVDVEALFRTFDQRSDAYLERHALQPPHVDWDAFEKLIAEVREDARKT